MAFRLSLDRRVEIDRAFAGRADDDLFHVAVGRVQQAAAFGGGQHRDGAGRAGGAQVGAFQGIDGDIDFGNFGAVGKLGADFFADVEHGRFVALAFADDDGAAHGNESMVLRMASVATWSASLRSPCPMVWAEAMAASSTTRRNLSARSLSMLRPKSLPWLLVSA